MDQQVEISDDIECSIELLEAASSLAFLKSEEEKKDNILRVVIVDTERSKAKPAELLGEEGLRFANVAGAEYFHDSNLTGLSLLR